MIAAVRPQAEELPQMLLSAEKVLKKGIRNLTFIVILFHFKYNKKEITFYRMRKL